MPRNDAVDSPNSRFGFEKRASKMIDLNTVIKAHTDLRDSVVAKTYGEWDLGSESFEYGLVLGRVFNYAFNTYKTIGLLLPELYYEQGCTLFRVLWESTLNLEWISQDPESRAKKFLQFTAVEYRKFLQLNLNQAKRKNNKDEIGVAEKMLHSFDKSLEGVLSDYRYKDKKGRVQFQSRFTGNSIEPLAREIGGQWYKEYVQIYPLVCSYAHGSPGAVIFPSPIVRKMDPEVFAETDRPRTILLGLWSMAIFERVYQRFANAAGIDNNEFLEDLDQKVHFRDSLLN